jgi:hypothetical protein
MADPRAENCRAYSQNSAGLVTGVELGITQVTNAKYEVYSVRLIDEATAAGNTIATCSVVDAKGISTGEQVRLTWPGKNVPFQDSGIAGNGQNVHVITNKFNPPALGPLALHVGEFNIPTSDIVFGFGLAWGHHISFVVIFIEKGTVIIDPDIASRLAAIEAELIKQAKAELIDDAVDIKQTTDLAAMRVLFTNEINAIKAVDRGQVAQLATLAARDVIFTNEINAQKAINRLQVAATTALDAKVVALSSGYSAHVAKIAALEAAAVATTNRFQAAEAVTSALAARVMILENGQGGAAYPLPSHRFGVHYIPGEGKQEHIEFIRRLKPAAVKVINGNKETLQLVLSLLDPNGLLIVRDHARSEQQNSLATDPVACGHRHALEWKNDFGSNGKYAGLLSNRIVVCAMNEPRVGDAVEEEKVVKYTTAFLNDLTTYGIRGLCLNLSVGWPRNMGTATPPNWEIFKPLQEVINRGNHIMGLHEYWYADPDEAWANMPNGVPFGWLAFRHHACPLQVPLLIGECGMTKAVDEARWVNDGRPPRGWIGNVSPSQYAEMFARYTNKCFPNVVATMLFTTGMASEDWREDSTDTAHNDIVARKVPHVFPTNFPIRPPAAGTVDIPPVLPGDPKTIIFPPMPRVTNFFGQLYNGISHSGIDISAITGTPILCPFDGSVVAYTGFDTDGYGNYIRVSLPAPISVDLLYGHLSEVYVKRGDVLPQGFIMGKSGSTGNSTGPHIHMEVRDKTAAGGYEPNVSSHINSSIDPFGFIAGWLAGGNKVELR